MVNTSFYRKKDYFISKLHFKGVKKSGVEPFNPLILFNGTAKPLNYDQKFILQISIYWQSPSFEKIDKYV